MEKDVMDIPSFGEFAKHIEENIDKMDVDELILTGSIFSDLNDMERRLFESKRFLGRASLVCCGCSAGMAGMAFPSLFAMFPVALAVFFGKDVVTKTQNRKISKNNIKNHRGLKKYALTKALEKSKEENDNAKEKALISPLLQEIVQNDFVKKMTYADKTRNNLLSASVSAGATCLVAGLSIFNQNPQLGAVSLVTASATAYFAKEAFDTHKAFSDYADDLQTSRTLKLSLEDTTL